MKYWDPFLHFYSLLHKSDYLRKESSNYIPYIIRKRKICYAIKKGKYALSKKNNIPLYYQGRHCFLNYPSVLSINEKISPSYFKIPVYFSKMEKFKTQLEINLATIKVPLTIKMDWKKRFVDKEDSFSLHRFSWTQPILTNQYGIFEILLLKDVIINWIEVNPYTEGTLGWDSYSISERLVNWLFILCVIKSCLKIEAKDLLKIVNSIRLQTKLLYSHLEFRGSSTNNHLIHNARTLYQMGMFLQNRKLKDCGKQILLYEYSNMFTPSGFLREGSSHYHILLCSIYLEILWFAITFGDYEFYNKICDRVKNIYRCGQFLLADGKLPFFGDVSPDFHPNFHMGLTEVGTMVFNEDKKKSPSNSLGWHSLFVTKLDEKKDEKVKLSDCMEDFVDYSDAGYYRFKNELYSIYIYINPFGYVPEWSHGHSDIGGFVLSWEGAPLFVDTGRPTYEKSTLGTYAKSVRSHNSISIDGFEPCVTHGLNGYAQIMIDEYFQRPPQVKVEKESSCVKISLEFYGYQRIKKNLVVKRTFSFYKEELIIEDIIHGNTKHFVETFFHLDPKVITIKKNCRIIFKTKSGCCLSMTPILGKSSSIDIFKGKYGREPSGWFFPSYGKTVSTYSIILSQNTKLPLHNTYIISRI